MPLMNLTNLTEADRDLIETALSMRAGYMETGCVTLRHNDAVNQGRHKEIRALSDHQRAMIVRMDELRTRLLTGK